MDSGKAGCRKNRVARRPLRIEADGRFGDGVIGVYLNGRPLHGVKGIEARVHADLPFVESTLTICTGILELIDCAEAAEAIEETPAAAVELPGILSNAPLPEPLPVGEPS